MVPHPLDPEPFEGLGQRLGVVELAVVRVPPARRPDFGVIARPDDDGVAIEAGRFAQVGRHEDPPLAVDLGLNRAREEEALEES